MKTYCCLLVLIGWALVGQAQTDSVYQQADSLKEVTVKSFYGDANWRTVAAAVNTLSKQQLDNGNPVSLVSVMNTLPGVRMEERSPASYRLSFRGSLLRSPFGVRNIKVYWNDFPLTDGGGNTYLNLVALSQINALELVKGPVASMYGAGTGGLLLLQSALDFTPEKKEQFKVVISGGSFGLFQQDAQWTKQTKHQTIQLQQSHQQGDGYRQQSAWKRDAIQFNSSWKWQQQQLDLLLLYTNLFYETPGGITFNQMLQNPKLARQAAGNLPGAMQQKAAIYNQTLFSGLSHQWQIHPNIKWQNSINYSGTDFKNPFITNYEKRKEKNIGARTVLTVFRKKSDLQWQWTSGAEWLHQHAIINNYTNNNGTAGSVLFADDVYAQQWFVFTQFKLQYKNLIATVGSSINQQLYRYQRTSDTVLKPFTNSNGKMNWSPRFSITGKLVKDVQWYAIAAQGFSPPTLAEVRPSAGNFSNDLRPEFGWNIEAGIKGYLFRKALQFDIATYRFTLQDAIVRRNDNTGAEYFINAGSTRQNGVEARITHQHQIKHWNAKYWSSFSYQPYRFNNYVQGTNNYSGNALTGVPKHILAAGTNINYNKTYFNIIYNYTSSLPLNDANTAIAEDYHLLQLKAGHHFRWKQHQLSVYIFADNVLDELYSLGNDINAAGNRFYNPAPTRNMVIGASISW
jgi:iron complex outermembrane receptor protein